MSLPTKARSINTTTELTIIVSWGTGTQWKSVFYPSTIHGFIVGGSLLGSLWLWLSNINTTHMLFASDLYESSELCWVNGNPSKLAGFSISETHADLIWVTNFSEPIMWQSFKSESWMHKQLVLVIHTMIKKCKLN